MRKGWLLLLILLPVFGAVQASSESSRIEGVAAFLIDRANDNYLYIFEKKIRDNEQFACYFPNTYENLEVGGLKELLYSRGLWSQSIQQDLDVLATRTVASSIEERLKLGRRAFELADALIVIGNNLEVEINGRRYPLMFIPTDEPRDVRDILNGFSKPFGDLVQAMNTFRRYRGDDICAMPASDLATVKQQVEPLLNLTRTLRRAADHFKAHADKLVLADASRGAICESLGIAGNCDISRDNIGDRVAELVVKHLDAALDEEDRDRFAASVVALDELVETYQDPASTYTAKVASALRMLKKSGSLEAGEFETVSRYVMFFAQVSDIDDSPEEVKQLLEAYTLPSVSFYTKREYGAHWMITSYLGIAGGETKPDLASMENENTNGLYAPIGVEWSYGFAGSGSLSIMLSPFDFAYPVNLKLNAIEEDADLDDVIAPSISVAYGLEEYPITFGVAYQKGRKLAGTDDVEERTLAFIAFDMPLWPL